MKTFVPSPNNQPSAALAHHQPTNFHTWPLICLFAVFTLNHAAGQGIVRFANTSTTLISYQGQPISSPPGFYFALLTAPVGTTDPALFTFSGIYATNLALSAGRIAGGPVTGVVVPGWQPGTVRSFLVCGWPATEGPYWNPAWNPASMGRSMIAQGIAGGTDPNTGESLPALVLFSSSTINAGFDLMTCLGPYFLYFTEWPTNQTVNPGEPAAFYVSATACPIPSYQWYHNAALIPGAIGHIYQIAAAQASDAGSYYAILSGIGWGSRTSSTGTLTVRPLAPTILQQPASQTIPAGWPVDFAVLAGGVAPLAYQWRFDDTPIPAATASTLHYDDVQLSAAGSYTVVITNTYGAITSAPAILSVVTQPPAITLAPWSRTTVAGRFADFVVQAQGSLPFTYQWFFNGSALAGATGTDLHLDNLQLTQSGYYWVTITNAYGAVTIAPVSLSVSSITVPPAGTPVTWGEHILPYAAPNARFTSIAAAADYSMAVQSDGNILGWGSRQSIIPQGLSNIVSVAAADYHTLALKADGTVLAWGENQHGECNVPPNLTGVVSIAAGLYYSLALRSDGTVVCWGDNSAGQCLGISGVVAIAAGEAHTLALLTNGQVIASGDNLYGQCNVPADLNGVVGIAAGKFHSLAVKSDGTVAAWGYNYDNSGNFVGESIVPPGLTGAVTVAAGFYHSLALKSDGTVVVWGDNHFSQAEVPATATGVTNIAAGGYHSLGQRSDGSLVAWPPSTSGGSPVPASSDIAAVAAGQYPSLALKIDGTVIAPSAPANLSNVVAVAAGGSHYVALRSDGTVVAWGFNNSGQTNVPPGLSNVIAVAAGFSHSLALKSDGTVVSWGGDFTVPPGLQGVTAVSAGFDHDLALKSDGTVVGWGHNYYGEATPPEGLRDVIAISAGNEHSLALKSDGTVVTWGLNRNGVTDVPPGLQNVIGIAAGDSHDLALRSDGSVIAWGDNSGGQCEVPPGLGAVIAVAAGGSQSLVLIAGLPAVIVAPRSQTAEIGSPVQFDVKAVGLPSLAYQWKFNGNTNLNGATNSVLHLDSVTAPNSGAYSVVITNLFGLVTSPPAMLNVIPVVDRRSALTLRLHGALGQPITIETVPALGSQGIWTPLETFTLTNQGQLYIDVPPLASARRFYRSWQPASGAASPSVFAYTVPALNLTGPIGSGIRIDAINQFGPTDAWTTLATVTLTNSPPEYFDTSDPTHPPRLYRLTPQ